MTIPMRRPRKRTLADQRPGFLARASKESTFECWKVSRQKKGFVFHSLHQDQLDVNVEHLSKNFNFDQGVAP